MNSNRGLENANSLLPNHEEPKSNFIPLRNAISSVKRPREPTRLGRLSFKPIRLGDLTQEWLEAKNEPLREVNINDGDVDAPSDDNKSLEELENALVDMNIESPKKNEQNLKKEPNEMSNNSGVIWLETPAKTRLFAKQEVFTRTPNINCVRSSTALDFLTPHVIKTTKEDKSACQPKIQYSMDIKGLLKTPINNFGERNKRNCQSLTKAPVRQNPYALRNVSGDDALNHKDINQQPFKSSLRNPNSVLHEKNKENGPNNKVQFSLPISEWSESLKEIEVKKVTYLILNQLGKGGSSVVYHCYNPVSKTEWAVKKVNLSNEAAAVGYINEVEVLARLQKCDRIVKMFDYELVESEKLLLVVLERGGLDLSKILKDLSNTKKHLPMHMLIFYWMEMLYAVKQIHENGIIHSDLKPANFLQAEGALKLIDFGIASCVQDDMTSVVKNIPVGSFNYVSPEALRNEPSNNCESPSYGKQKFKVSYKSDVWSLGCILYQLVYRRTPFQHIGHMWAKLSAIMDPNHKIDYPEVDWVPLRIVNTIQSCLQHDMKARPSVDELIQEYEDIYN